MRQHRAAADGAGKREGADRRAPGHVARGPDQLVALAVMAGLVPAIHVLEARCGCKTWMPGTRPGMTKETAMLEEFKKFALRGNVVDLAIGVIIGAAFSGIVNSLVGDVIMPIIGAITGGIDFSNYYIPLSSKVTAT